MEPRVTIGIVPRERFSVARRSLESVFAATRLPFRLVYVDGASPPPLRRYLEAQARGKRFELIRTEHHLAPNEARNMVIYRANTPYVVFVDNDVIVSPGWLERLVACADETGAWVVGPLCLIDRRGEVRVHMAGGVVRIEEGEHGRRLRESHRFANRTLEDVKDSLKREPCEQVEFHTMLVRRDVFDRLGPLDERMKSANAHLDLCLSVREAGGEIYLEPVSVVTYEAPPPFGRGDRQFFLLRWSDEWNRASHERFIERWDLNRSDGQLAAQWVWLRDHRSLAYHWPVKLACRFGVRFRDWVATRVDARFDRKYVQPARERRALATAEASAKASQLPEQP